MSNEQKPKASVTTLVAALVIVTTVVIVWISRRPSEQAKEPAPQQRESNALTGSISVVTAPRQTPHEALVAALVAFSAEADIIRREEQLEAWLSEVAYGDIPEFIALLNKEPASKLTGEIKLRLFRKLAGNDPTAAARLVAQQPEGAERQKLLEAVATVWAGLNVADAVAWARELPEEERAGAFLKIASEEIATDPRAALELAREIPPSEARDELVGHVASEWAAKNPDEIAAWAEKIGDTSLREAVVSKVAIAWGDTDPAKAAALALNQLSPGKPQDDAVVGIVQRWVQSHPADAAAWVAMFPEGELRETAARELVNLWTDKNATDAGKWASELPPGTSRDTAVGAYVGKIAATLPEVAAQWVAGITDVALRDRQMEAVAVTWLAKDPAAARKWIASSPLPDDAKEKILSVAPR